MARSINYEVKNKIYQYLKEQWYFYRQQNFSCPLVKIARFIGSTPEMVWYYVSMLEEERLIIVERGIGRKPNKYGINKFKLVEQTKNDQINNEQINHQVQEQIQDQDNQPNQSNQSSQSNQIEDSQKNTNDLNNLINEFTGGIKQIRELYAIKNRYYYLLNSLEQLQIIGETNDGKQLFSIPNDFHLKEMIQTVKQIEQ